jgi:hypothetical protein
VVLLPVYEFLRANPLFTTVLLEDLASLEDADQTNPFPCTLITFSSYLCTHASTVYTARSIAYAKLALNTLLVLVENGVFMEFMTQTRFPSIHICRQVSRFGFLSVGLLNMVPETAFTPISTKTSTTHKLDTRLLCIVVTTQSP